MRALGTFAVAALMTTAGCRFSHAAERVDLLLVLAADVSNSMKEAKFELQRSGYAAAFSNPQVIAAIRAGVSGRIAVAFVEWSGIAQHARSTKTAHPGVRPDRTSSIICRRNSGA